MARKYLRWVDSPLWMKICKNIRDCRKWKGAAQEQVASKAGIDLKRYKRMERAVIRDVTFDEVFRISKALRINYEDIDNIIHF